MPTSAVPASAPAAIALVGNYTPRRCGIATFTHDLGRALAAAAPRTDVRVVAMTDSAGPYDYPPLVSFEIAEERIESYVAAAEYLNFGNVDLVVLQHEFGIFGGEAGGQVLHLLRHLKMPVVTTLHTVLTDPSPAQRRVMEALIARSARLIVMADKGREILEATYAVDPAQIAVIPHGVPDQPFLDGALAKDSAGFAGRDMLLTFGLLGPGKGIETMIDAMPAVAAANPRALYVVLGATHPNLKRHEGERYRESLIAQAERLGVATNVAFVDGFVSDEALITHMAAADVYVTPYPNEAQITSGTLAISFGMGKPIVSTPFWHAKELLADGRGVLVPFADPAAMAGAINRILSDRDHRDTLRKRAYAAGRATIWPVVAARHHALFATVVAGRLERAANVVPLKTGRPLPSLPAMQLSHLSTMTDGTGLLQHAILSVADRAHGYCLDDNARALLLMAEMHRAGAWSEREIGLALTYAAFVQHAWNAERGRFRNFMSYAREWLDETGHDDAHARAIWALGILAERGGPRQLGDWATSLFLAAASALGEMGSPRGWALGALGLNAFLRRFGGQRAIDRLRGDLAARLHQRFKDATGAGWTWFEDRLAYDNARLPQALIECGHALGRADMMADGLAALEWLMAQQTAPAGHFRPIGTDSFGRDRLAPLPFDQQSIEISATIGACLAAHTATGRAHWAEEAHRAFAWFGGANDLKVTMTDAESGAGFDGLHPDRRNANQGAESTLAYLQSLSDMHALMARPATGGGTLERVA